MKYSALFIFFIAMMWGCSTGTKVASVKETADQAFDNANYTAALAGYEQIIREFETEGRTDECPVYGKAGLAAMETGNINKALDYLQMDIYTAFATAETYRGLAGGYRKIDNLSKEIMALKDYISKFPEGEHIDEIRTRLFETYVESENWEFAVELWPQLPDSEKDESLISKWFAVNRALENNDQANIISIRLLKINPNHIPALEWQAEMAYDKAESHYQREMEAYEKNKTNRQYKKLLEELKVVTTEFQDAKQRYKKLYDLDPKPEYARYLSNIYVRLNDKEKADYYRQKSGN